MQLVHTLFSLFLTLYFWQYHFFFSVWGCVGDAEEQKKRKVNGQKQTEKQVLLYSPKRKPFSLFFSMRASFTQVDAELGNINVASIVPGNYTRKEMQRMCGHLAHVRVFNGGHTCPSPQVWRVIFSSIFFCVNRSICLWNVRRGKNHEGWLWIELWREFYESLLFDWEISSRSYLCLLIGHSSTTSLTKWRKSYPLTCPFLATTLAHKQSTSSFRRSMSKMQLSCVMRELMNVSMDISLLSLSRTFQKTQISSKNSSRFVLLWVCFLWMFRVRRKRSVSMLSNLSMRMFGGISRQQCLLIRPLCRVKKISFAKWWMSLKWEQWEWTYGEGCVSSFLTFTGVLTLVCISRLFHFEIFFPFFLIFLFLF